MHSLASRPRMSETEPKWFMFETSSYAFGSDSDVAGMWQGCGRDVTEMWHGCDRDDPVMWQGCDRDDAVLRQGCSRDVTEMTL